MNSRCWPAKTAQSEKVSCPQGDTRQTNSGSTGINLPSVVDDIMWALQCQQKGEQCMAALRDLSGQPLALYKQQTGSVLCTYFVLLGRAWSMCRCTSSFSTTSCTAHHQHNHARRLICQLLLMPGEVEAL